KLLCFITSYWCNRSGIYFHIPWLDWFIHLAIINLSCIAICHQICTKRRTTKRIHRCNRSVPNRGNSCCLDDVCIQLQLVIFTWIHCSACRIFTLYRQSENSVSLCFHLLWKVFLIFDWILFLYYLFQHMYYLQSLGHHLEQLRNILIVDKLFHYPSYSLA